MMTISTTRFGSMTLGLLLTICVAAAAAAPDAELWPRWQAHDPDDTRSIDHSAWTEFLRTYREIDAEGVARLDYGAVSEEDRRMLDAYVDDLTGRKITTFARAEQYAYWLNLYNALTVRVVLEHYPVDSIRDIDISPGLFADGPWGRELVTIEGAGVSLDDIEHRILRPIWDDPRIHYGVNCAAVDCPNLRPHAFTAGNVDGELGVAAREYVNGPRGLTMEDGRVIASSIYKWFREDFGGSEAGVLRHLRRYAEPDLRERLEGVKRIDRYRYDWSLNDVVD